MIDPALLASSYGGTLLLESFGVIRTGGGLAATAQSGTWADGVLFGNRPVQSSVINLNGVNGQTISNLYFDNSGLNPSSPFVFSGNNGDNSHVCLNLINCSDLIIEYVDFEEVSQPIQCYDCTNIEIRYVRAKGIVGPGTRFNAQTGNFIQTHGTCNNVRVHNAKIIATTAFTSNPSQWPQFGTVNVGTPSVPRYNPTCMMCEDIVSFYGAVNCGIEDSQIDGTGYLRSSGTGIILGDSVGADNYARRNTLINAGQVQVNVVGGHDHFVQDNWVWADSYGNGYNFFLANDSRGDPYYYGENQCMVHYQYQSNPLSGVTFSGNRTYSVNGRNYWSSPPPEFSFGNVYGDNTLVRSDFLIDMNAPGPSL